ncbi:MAG: integrin [Gammaproteobacteria bacterium]|nr:integrin [Gammaproteobacteria bacterium]
MELKIFAVVAVVLALTACFHDNEDGTMVIPGQPVLTFTPVKTFHFSWVDVSDATHYKLMENPDGISGFAQVGSDIPQGTQIYDHAVPLYARVNAQYVLQNCNAAGCTDSDTVSVSGTLVGSIGYFKASITDGGDYFGDEVSLSADGSTLVVGAPGEGGIATGINGDQADNSAPSAGAVYVFSRSGTTWIQQAYIKASNSDEGDNFGSAISLSADSNTLAVGAYREGSSSIGVDGDQTDNSAVSAGAVYVFGRIDANWSQQEYLKADSINSSDMFTSDYFGHKVNLSGDGNTLAICAPHFSILPSDESRVFIFSRNNMSWTQQFRIDVIDVAAILNSDVFNSVNLSIDGNTLAVGVAAYRRGGFPPGPGKVLIYNRSELNWVLGAEISANYYNSTNNFGSAVTLSADGHTLAVGATYEGSSATGINGDQTDSSVVGAGAVYVFNLRDTSWIQQAYIKASNTDEGDSFGSALSLSADGDTLAVGAIYEGSSATGINGDQTDNSTSGAGAVYLY